MWEFRMQHCLDLFPKKLGSYGLPDERDLVHNVPQGVRDIYIASLKREAMRNGVPDKCFRIWW